MKQTVFVFIAAVAISFLCLSCERKTLEKPNFQPRPPFTNSYDRVSLMYYRRLWEDREPQHYKYSFSAACECKLSTTYAAPFNKEHPGEFATQHWIRVEVKNGRVEAIFHEDGTRDFDYANVSKGINLLTFIFREVETAYETNAKRLEVTFDPDWGYIRRAFIDRTDSADDDVTYAVRDIEVIKP